MWCNARTRDSRRIRPAHPLPGRLACIVVLAFPLALIGCGDDESSGEAEATLDREPRTRPEGGLVAEGCAEKPPLIERQSILGCAKFTEGRSLQLRSDRVSGRGNQCIEVYGMGDRKSRACAGGNFSKPPPPDVYSDAYVQTGPGEPVEVYGPVSTRVESVVIETRGPRSGRQRTDATIIPIKDTQVLEQVGLSRPFGYYVAEVPEDSISDWGEVGPVRVVAVGFDQMGERLDQVNFNRLHGLPRTAFQYSRELR